MHRDSFTYSLRKSVSAYKIVRPLVLHIVNHSVCGLRKNFLPLVSVLSINEGSKVLRCTLQNTEPNGRKVTSLSPTAGVYWRVGSMAQSPGLDCGAQYLTLAWVLSALPGSMLSGLTNVKFSKCKKDKTIFVFIELRWMTCHVVMKHPVIT